MSVINQLATSLNRKDEVPNQELAKQIVAVNNTNAVTELVAAIQHKNTDIQNDCIKVLYEIGYTNPLLIAAYYKEFLALLTHKNNRLQWGAMAALDCIASVKPKEIYNAIPQIINAANKGSVITRDNAVNILIKLSATKSYADNCFHLLNEQLLSTPVNQLAMYAERMLVIITSTNSKTFIQTLTSRLKDIEKDSQRNRIEKVIKKVSKL